MAWGEDLTKIVLYTHVNCIRNYASHKAIVSFTDLPVTRSNFWRIAANATLDIAIIEWCKLFGSDSEATHWKRIYPDAVDLFRASILAETGWTQDVWGETHRRILDYRNKNAAHVDVDDWSRDVPQLEAAMNVVHVGFDWFRRVTGDTRDLRAEYDVQFRSTTSDIQRFLRGDVS